MFNSKELNYGVLYHFQPDYLRDVQDDMTAQLEEPKTTESSGSWQSFASEVGAFFTKS